MHRMTCLRLLSALGLFVLSFFSAKPGFAQTIVNSLVTIRETSTERSVQDRLIEFTIENDRGNPLPDGRFPVLWTAILSEYSSAVGQVSSNQCPDLWSVLAEISHLGAADPVLPGVNNPEGSQSMAAHLHGPTYQIRFSSMVGGVRGTTAHRAADGEVARVAKQAIDTVRACLAG